MKIHKKRFLTGIKPTGEIHLGNYYGAIAPAIEASHNPEYEVLLVCVDWHGLTNRVEMLMPGHLTHKLISVYLALGFNLKNNSVILQSDFKEIQENAWYLGCSSSSGLLERAHAYKDALANGKESSCGLLNYPLLMSADIVTFDAEVVPVGKDQLQHLEYASDMVKSFHHLTQKQVYTEPTPKIEDIPILVGADGRKMSKSYNNVIPLFGTHSEIEKRVKEIKTDSKSMDEPKNSDECLIFQIFKSFASSDAVAYMKESLERGKGYGYGHAKKDFLMEHQRVFGDKQKLFEYYLANPEEVKSLLSNGYKRAQNYAATVTQRARDALGLRSYRP